MSIISKLFGKPEAGDPLDALLAEASRNPARREAFYRALLGAVLWVPGENGAEEVNVGAYQIFGRNMLLAFTSRANAASLRDRPPMMELPAATVFAVASAFEGMILNYGTATEKEFTLPELRGILDGSIFNLVEGPRAMLLGQPKEYPVRLMNDLARAFPSRAEIAAAYIAQVSQEGTLADPTIVIGVEAAMNDEEFEAVRLKLQALAQTAGAGGVAFVKLGDDAIAEYMRTETKAFYERLKSEF